jgi:hypothetical protein
LVEVTVVQVVRPHATNKERDPRVSWFVWIGDQEADVVQIALGYVLRFGQEHGYRFDKQAMLWEKPRLRTPEQFERWTQIVAIAHNQVVLARNLVKAQRRPWENKRRPPTFKSRFFGKHELSSGSSSTCSLLLPTFVLPLPLFLPSLGRRQRLSGRQDSLRPLFRQEPTNGQIFCMQESSSKNQSSPLGTAQRANRWLG